MRDSTSLHAQTCGQQDHAVPLPPDQGQGWARGSPSHSWPDGQSDCPLKVPGARVRLHFHFILTFSSINNANFVRTIEGNLDAVCKTPREHRSELIEHVHRPRLERIAFTPCVSEEQGTGSRLIRPLIKCIASYNRDDDPYIERLQRNPKAEANASTTQRTYCFEQLEKFRQDSFVIYEELGGWAADYFIQTSVDHLRLSVENDNSMTGMDREERIYLFELLSGVNVPEDTVSTHMSPKLEALLAFLAEADDAGFSGLIFAKRRIVVCILSRFLSIHPATRDRFRCAAFVGWSNSSGRKEVLGDLLTREMQQDTLSEFRAGRKNLIVTTDVLEEGLDVSSCSLVICYDKPSNLKSFVQRRGRARHQKSTYAIMISTVDDSLDLHKWQQLEDAMVAAYQDDERRRREAMKLEMVEENVSEFLVVESTGAVLSPDDAMQHLTHFCAVLPVDEYADNRPSFFFDEDVASRIRATVTLPNSVHPAVRRSQGKGWWLTERAARKDAAFQAYKELWKYGLVNDNLLPLTRKPELRFTEDEPMPAILKCSEQWDPYVGLAQAWSSPQFHQTTITFSKRGTVDEDLMVSLVLPKEATMPEPITMYWENDGTFIAKMATPLPIPDMSSETLQTMKDITAMYLQAPSSRKRGPERDFVALFVPTVAQHDQLTEWIRTYQGTEMAEDFYERDPVTPPIGIIRDTAKYSEPRQFRQWVVSGVEEEKPRLEIECQSLPRRRNFLQGATHEEGEPGPPKIYVVPAGGCTIDKLPLNKAIFGLLISALLDRLEATMVAAHLNDTILKGVNIQSTSHVLTAITAPTAQADTHYQLYEFFGDSVLKFTVSCQLFFRQPKWHEGYLSESRDKLINNKRLARAALDTELDKFILAKRFTPRRWNPPLISQKLGAKPGTRDISMKVLADVVEALIGAAFMDGGMNKAQTCLHRFLPEIEIFTANIGSYLGPRQESASRIVDPHCLAHVIGYTFQDASYLTEALTHPSCESDTTTQSYQRIEYLGDAVLDIIVMLVLAANPTALSQGQMTLVKHAVVNANLLAFFCMEMSVDPGIEDNIHLWTFLRFNGPVISTARNACLERHAALREEIRACMDHDDRYPWEQLARLRADKFMSDIMESTLGAMFLDSRGDLDVCSRFVERTGLLPYLRRILDDGVDVQHPRNKAQNMVRGGSQLTFKSRRVEKKGEQATYRCVATLNKKELVLVEGCGSAEEAEVRAAHLAIEKLRNDPSISGQM